MPDRPELELALCAFGQRGGETDRPRQAPLGHHLLHAPQHEVDQEALQAEELADTGHDHLLDAGFADHLLQGVREILHHDDHFGAAIGQLMLSSRGV